MLRLERFSRGWRGDRGRRLRFLNPISWCINLIMPRHMHVTCNYAGQSYHWTAFVMLWRPDVGGAVRSLGKKLVRAECPRTVGEMMP